MKALLIIGLVVLAIVLYNKFFKIPKLNSLVLVSGGVKTGKSTMSVYFALKKYRRALFCYRLAKIFFSIFPKKAKALEKPLLYSNVPLAVPYVPLTEDLILRKKRFAYRSVVYIQEASLLADSMNWHDDTVNDNVRLLCKLIAHETKGGCCILDSQQPSDLHYGIKRNLSTYFYIHRSFHIPFFLICYVREMLYSDESGVQNVFDDDVEFGLRRVIIPTRVWKKFDCYTYSALTDHLPCVQDEVDGTKLPDLKSRDYVHFKKAKKEDKKDGKKVK